MKRTVLSLALMAACVASFPAAAAQQNAPIAMAAAAVAVPDPASQLEEAAQLFRAGDLVGLAQTLMPPSKWDQLRLLYDLQRVQPASEEQRAEFAEALQRFTAPDAVEQLMAELEPQLEKARPQAPGALLMAFGAMQVAIASPESELTEEQRAALQGALPGIQQWASSTDFLSSDALRRALTLVTDAARRSGVDDIDDIRAMPLEAVLDRAAPVFAAAKQAVRLYGIDLDAVADSLQVEVLEIQGDTARVRTSVTVFDAPLWAEHDMVLVEGRWYGKQTIVQFDAGHDGDREPEAVDAKG